jgi:AcrR family transcriptional regulator
VSPETKTSRAEHTEQISRRLREVALQHIAEVGIDGLSMVRIAQDSELSKSPLYRRYDDVIDVAVDVWDHHLRDHLAHLIDEVGSYAESGNEKSLLWLCKEMHKSSVKSSALIECMTAARRYEYLQETVEIDVQDEVDRYLARLHNLPRDIALSYLVYVLGGLFVGSLLTCTREQIQSGFELWSSHLRNPSLYVDLDMPDDIQPIPLRMSDTEDPVLGHLVTAATKVITRTGFENATANRIARYADKAFSTSYSYFDSKEELMTYATEFVFRDSIVRNDLMFIRGDILDQTHRAASRVFELSNPSHSEDVRLFRIESTLAARHHKLLKESVRDLFSQSLNQVLSVAEKKKSSKDSVRSVWIGVRLSGFGHNIFGLVAPRFRDTNWMSTSHAAAHVVRYHAMAHYVENFDEILAS